MRRRTSDDRDAPVAGRRPRGDGLAVIPDTIPTSPSGRAARTANVTAGRPSPLARRQETRAMHLQPPRHERPTPISRHHRYEERSVMTYQPLTYLTAEARRQQMMAEAEMARSVAQAQPARTARPAAIVAAVRRQIGTALVQTGERLQGAGTAPELEVELDTNPSGGVLRLAR